MKKELTQTFEMRDIGDLSYCLGIEFSRDQNGGVQMSQEKYIKKIIEKFGMAQAKPVKTPMEVPKKGELPNLPYQSLIGSLMYLATATRPDIAYSVSYLSQFNSYYRQEHWNAAKRILRYLKGTDTLALQYRKTGKTELSGKSDASYASCKIDGRSYTGYCFQLNGSAISWEARKQRTVAGSTAQAEYMGLSESAKEAMHLKYLVNHLRIIHETVNIKTDSQGAISWAKNPVVTSKAKYIAIKEHFIREAVANNDIKLEFCPTDEMTADVFTKALPGPKLYEFRRRLGLGSRQ